MNTRWLLWLLTAVVSMAAPAGLARAETPPSNARTAVLFVGGYGSSALIASQAFSPLRSALQVRDPSIAFAQFSYAGLSAQTCAPLDYSPADTGQDFDTSKQRLLDTVYALRTRCGAE